MKLPTINNRYNIMRRSIDEQPPFSFSILYDEVLKRGSLKKSKSKSTFLSHHTTTSNRRFTTQKSQGYIPTFDPDKFNLVKKIKEIQRLTKEKQLDPLQNDNRVSFSKDKIHIVYESTKLLKDINTRKNNSMNDEGESLSTFLTGSKEISINNLLIKLLKEESDKLENKELKVSKALKEEQETLRVDQRNFLKYSEMQKKACKEIEKVLKDIKQKHIALAQDEKTIKAELRYYEEEMLKVLDHIDTYRVCGKFIHHVFGENVSTFETKILTDKRKIKFFQSEDDDDDDEEKEKKINFDEITQQVLDNYDFILCDYFIQKMNDLLRDPELMMLSFKGFEDSILRMLLQKAEIDEERILSEQEHNAFLKELASREESQSKQLDIITEEYFHLLGECERININYDLENMEYYELVKELNQTMIEENLNSLVEKGNVNKYQTNRKKHIVEIAFDSLKMILDLERVVNQTINQMEMYMNEDKEVFMQSVIMRKNEIKEAKQAIAKMKLEQILNNKRMKAQARMNKVVVKSRKTEAPFRFMKKEKVVVVHEETTHQEEDKNLIDY